ncbi:MAG: hypothetical protein KGQ54_03475 [Verrucomicrobia bacterium]|nr:hypothetical protein [Verrucomicrobiota bacterium]
MTQQSIILTAPWLSRFPIFDMIVEASTQRSKKLKISLNMTDGTRSSLSVRQKNPVFLSQ